MAQRLRIFVSSPGDVPDERLRADLIIDKLAQDYRRFFAIESYRWEHEPMLASAHFQDVIEPPSKFDIVVLILWSRLGTYLPEKTGLREYRGIDNRAPVTGTEWEYEEALTAARDKGAPDLLAFRNVSDAPVDPRDPDARARSIAQLDALDAFWRRHFADRGAFLAAYDEYRTLDEFARRLEESLAKLIERRCGEVLARGAPGSDPTWFKEPFRGLEPYEFEHAAIFFGRDALATKATEQLAANARAGLAFLLLSGPSGSGKSSLAKAAVVPRLMKPQRISGTAFLRRAVFRPGAAGGDIILAFAQTIVRAGPGPDVGLPELLAPGQDVAKLADYLRSGAARPGFVFENALGRLTQAARASGEILPFESAKLILVVDQMEEIFTSPGVTAEDRRLFVTLLEGLARSGSVWVAATMRADFWHRAAEMPELIALAAGNGRLDVAPALPGELAEMIRRPAEAAGLSFETHKESGVRLDALVAEHAAGEPGVLPLLSFALDELYKDMKARGSSMLTYASYEALGELQGAIAKRADDIVAGLPAEAQATLPHVLRALATVSDAEDLVPVARPVPLERFAAGSPARVLVDAFTAGRLLVAAGEGGTATVRLAHEALIGRWQRARNQLAADRRDLATRKLIEQQLRRYNGAAGLRARRRLLLRNPDLASAVDLARRWADELDAPTRDFIGRSKRRARTAFMLTAAAAGMFGILALVAGWAAWRAIVAENLARSRADEALIAQSRSLVAQVYQLKTASNPQNALALALEALPSSMTNPDRPYTTEAEWMTRDAYRFALTNDLERVWTTEIPDRIDVASLSPDAETVALASDRVVRVIDRRTGATFILPDGDDPVWAMRFLPRANELVVASKSALRVFDLAAKSDMMTVTAPPGRHICGWSFDPNAPPDRPVEVFIDDGSETPARVKLATLGQGVEMAVDAGKCIPATSPLASVLQTMERNFPQISSFIFLSTPSRSAMVWIDTSFKLWIQGSGNVREVPSAAGEKFIAGIPASGGTQAVAALEDGRIAIVDVTNLTRLKETPSPGKAMAGIDVSANDQYVLVGYRDKVAEIWARRSHDELRVLGPASALADANLPTCQSPEAERHVDTRDGAVRLRIAPDLANLAKVAAGTESVVARLGEANARIRDAVFSSDEGRVIVVAEPNDKPADKVILTYDVGSGKLLDRKSHAAGPGNLCVRVSPDGRRLVIVNAAELRIVDASTGNLVREFKLPANRPYRVAGIAFNPAGDRLAALDSDGVFYMSDAGSGAIVDQYGSPFLAGNAPAALGFDASGSRLLLVRNNAAYAWSFIASVQDLMDAARAYVPSCIAPAQRRDFFLSDEPAAWCIELGKPPYDGAAWKQWLAEKKAGRMAPMPTAAASN